MTNAMEQSPLWRRTYAEESVKDPIVSKLVTSLRGARERASLLTSRVVGSLPGLTQHDISHLDALWEVASTIAGDGYTLNPLEGYLFGTAVLLHDAALCHEAYSGGRDAVRATTHWRDAYNRRLTNQGKVDPNDVDFEALRSLHATQAATLATKPWESDDGDPWYIIDDADLRREYGPLIGQIASSHHWDIQDVATTFAIPRPPASFLHPDWSADPLTVACLLRAADAGHMSSARAPTFLLKILEMNSVSKLHWTPKIISATCRTTKKTHRSWLSRPQLRFPGSKHRHGGWHMTWSINWTGSSSSAIPCFALPEEAPVPLRP